MISCYDYCYYYDIIPTSLDAAVYGYDGDDHDADEKNDSFNRIAVVIGQEQKRG